MGDIRGPVYRGRGMGGPSDFVMLTFIGWVGGWFLALFVKAEDLNFMTAYPYQSLCRTIAGAMIVIGVASGAFLAFAFR